MKKKKSKSMYLVLTLLLLLVAGFTTYAIYKTSATGTANVSAANWIVKVTANNTTTNVTGGASNISLGTCPNLLSPGSSCTIPFTVDMTESEVDSILTVGIGNSIDASTLTLMNEAGLSLKISDGINIQNAYTLNYGTTKTLNLVIDWEAGEETDDEKASADVALSKTVGTLSIPVNMIVRQYNGITRTVTFNTHDSNITTPEAITVSDGGYVTNIPVLANKENLVFGGWYTSQVGGTKLTSTTPIIENTEYHARFREPQNITITFNSNGGSSVASQTILEGSTINPLPESILEGYSLSGWYDSDNQLLTTSTKIMESKEYTAHWLKTYAVGEYVYFNPIDESDTNICNSSNSGVSPTGHCMTFNVIKDNGNTVLLQLDHNIVNKTSWYCRSEGLDNSLGPVSANNSLASATSGWNNVQAIQNEQDEMVKARLITYDEILEVNNNSTTNLPSWLRQNTNSNAYDESNSGYWTSTPDAGTSSQAYAIYGYGGKVGSYYTGCGSIYYGVRPVISVEKSKL